MIRHIATDEKFIDMGVNVFENAYPNCNELLLLSSTQKIQLVVFPPKEILTKRKLKYKSKDRNFWEGVDVVVFHSLCTFDITIPRGIKVIWLGFGFDYYNLIFSHKLDFFGNKTAGIAIKTNPPKNAKMLIISLIKKVIFRNYFIKKKRNKLIERVDIFCPVLTTEYDLITWPCKSKPKLMDWNYGTMEDNWAKNINIKLNGKNILLGNSATFTNNHIEAIDIISKVSNLSSDLIIPLSYGDKKCVSIVKEYADKNFQGKVIPLEGFIDFDDYIKLISSCSFVIMAHKRQQGLGNIILMLNLGAKIFLDSSNPVYSFLTDKGCTLFTLEDINSSDFQTELTERQIIHNQNILLEIWGKDSILNKTKQLIECNL